MNELQYSMSIKCTVSLDNQPQFLRITIGSRGEVVVNYLIFAGILYSKQINEPEPNALARHEASKLHNWLSASWQYLQISCMYPLKEY